MLITENQLRRIIRQTILEEQSRIDESSNQFEQFKQAARAALMAAGIAFTPQLVMSMASQMQDFASRTTNQERSVAHHRSIENEEGVDRLLGLYGEAIHMFVTQNPTLRRSAEIRKAKDVARAEQDLISAGVDESDIDAAFEKYYQKARIYAY